MMILFSNERIPVWFIEQALVKASPQSGSIQNVIRLIEADSPAADSNQLSTVFFWISSYFGFHVKPCNS